MSTYQPGACNIGPDQRRRRLTVASVAFGVAALQIGTTAMGWLPDPLLVGVFVPLAVGFEYSLQAYTAFCVRLAMLDRYDFRGAGGSAGEITDPDHRHADDLQAAKLAAAGVLLGAIATAILLAVWNGVL